ncbi:Serine/threonine-protein kinase [Rhynchospora pubera]|uniref:non-specific serine/threonine protein kinase n=1 Tax=Rhynchospora pubera TaxID=906938 RepID=A0AAV8DXP4_9POAL|nr:Serine/threonine-protein kinase [Rhynchospora pubera]
MLGLFTTLTVIPFLFFSTDAVGSVGTLAISLGTSTVCGISAYTFPRNIYCTNILESVPTSPYLIYPNVSFDYVSAGTTFLCGLKSSRRAIFCWNGNPVNTKQVYKGQWALSDISVGETHVSAIDHLGNEIRWWSKADLFPSSVHGNYTSLTSGNNFTCAITSKGKVKCWGPLSRAIQHSFSKYSMTTIVAGDSHMCGLDTSGFVICKGSNSLGQSYVPPGLPYDYTRFALGSSHTCAIKHPNGTAVCWGGSNGAHLYTPLNDTSFELLVAAGNITCGLATGNLSVLCWGSGWRTVSVRTLPLPMILPGICIAEGSDECKCGFYPDSGSLCAGVGVICRRCDTLWIQQLLHPELFPWPSESKRWMVEIIVGSVCMFVSVRGIIFSLSSIFDFMQN